MTAPGGAGASSPGDARLAPSVPASTLAGDGAGLPPTGNLLPPGTRPDANVPMTATPSVAAEGLTAQHGDPRQALSAQPHRSATGWFSAASGAPAADRAVSAATDAPILEPLPADLRDQALMRSAREASRRAVEMPTSTGGATATPTALQPGVSSGVGALAAAVSPLADAASGSATSTPAAAALASPLNLAKPGWDKALGQRVVMMAARGIESAELRLDPPQLGSIQVKLAMQGEQTQLLLQVANPAAREAVEQALPRLRDMLDSEGLQLEHAQVSEGDTASAQQHSRDQAAADADSASGEAAPDDDTAGGHVETLTVEPGRIYERV